MAFAEQLITIDELRARMPDMRVRAANQRRQIEAIDAQLADRDSYLKLADDLHTFVAQPRGSAAPPTSASGNACCGCWPLATGGRVGRRQRQWG